MGFEWGAGGRGGGIGGSSSCWGDLGEVCEGWGIDRNTLMNSEGNEWEETKLSEIEIYQSGSL